MKDLDKKALKETARQICNFTYKTAKYSSAVALAPYIIPRIDRYISNDWKSNRVLLGTTLSLISGLGESIIFQEFIAEHPSILLIPAATNIASGFYELYRYNKNKGKTASPIPTATPTPSPLEAKAENPEIQFEVKELNGNGRITIGRYNGDEIYVTCLGETLAFGLVRTIGSYGWVMSKIDANKGLRPTTAQTLSLLNLAFQNPKDDPCKHIINLTNEDDGYFWTSTENLWGKEDVIVYDNVDGKMPHDRKSLIKRYKDGDKAVRVVPYGFQIGRQSVDRMLKNPYVIAQIGSKDMLDVVKNVAKEFKNPPQIDFIGILDNEDEVHGYTALNFGLANRLNLQGFYGGKGFAFQMRIPAPEELKDLQKAQTPETKPEAKPNSTKQNEIPNPWDVKIDPLENRVYGGAN